MAREVKIKTSTGAAITIPESFKNFIIKDSEGKAVQVDELKVKTSTSDTTGTTVWKYTEPTSGGSTQDPTQPPLDPTDPSPEICGTCEAGTYVHYPSIPSDLMPRRFDCEKWADTGNFINLELQYTIPFNLTQGGYIGAGAQEGVMAKVYKIKDLNFAGFLPPPPGYTMMDYETYGIKDKISLYLRKKSVLKMNRVRDPSSFLYKRTQDGSTCTPLSYPVLPTYRNDTIINGQNIGNPVDGQISGTGTNILYGSGFGNNCGLNYAIDLRTGTYFGYCLQGFDNKPICGCGGGSGCFNTGAGPVSTGSGCTSFDDIPENNIILDSTCISTSQVPDATCDTFCYGKPKTNIPNDESPYGVYRCRTVNRIPNIILPPSPVFSSEPDNYPYNLDNTTFNFNLFDNYIGQQSENVANSLYKFSDFGFILQNDCNDTGEPSSWKARVFLPIYVNMEEIGGSSPVNGNINWRNLVGKLIEMDGYVQSPVTGDLLEWTESNVPYTVLGTNTDSLGKGLLHLTMDVGMDKIAGSSIFISPLVNGFDSSVIESSLKTDSLLWGITGYPGPIGTPRQKTHVVVLELVQENSTCNACINGIFGTSGQPNSVYTSMFRYYPITTEPDANGNFDYIDNFKQFLFNASNSTNLLDIDQVYYTNRIGCIRGAGLTLDTNPNINNTIYLQTPLGNNHRKLTWTANNIASSTYDISQNIINPAITINNLTNIIQQKQIKSTVETTCKCEPITSSFIAPANLDRYKLTFVSSSVSTQILSAYYANPISSLVTQVSDAAFETTNPQFWLKQDITENGFDTPSQNYQNKCSIYDKTYSNKAYSNKIVFNIEFNDVSQALTWFNTSSANSIVIETSSGRRLYTGGSGSATNLSSGGIGRIALVLRELNTVTSTYDTIKDLTVANESGIWYIYPPGES